MKPKHALFATTLFLLFAFTACKKTEQADLREEVLALFNFEPNSIWVYKNDQTGDLDSTHVTSLSISREEITTFDGIQYDTEVYEIVLSHSNLFGQGPQETSTRMQARTGGDYYVTWMNSAYISSTHPNLGKVPGIALLKVWEGYEVNGKGFPNVVEVIDSADVNAGGLVTHNFYAPKYGLIQKEIPATGEVWKMVRANLLQTVKPD